MTIEQRVDDFMAKNFGGYRQAMLPHVRQNLIDLCNQVMIDTAKSAVECVTQFAKEMQARQLTKSVQGET